MCAAAKPAAHDRRTFSPHFPIHECTQTSRGDVGSVSRRPPLRALWDGICEVGTAIKEQGEARAAANDGGGGGGKRPVVTGDI